MDDKMIFNFLSESEWVTLYTEDGEEIECEILKRFDTDGITYAVIRPAEENELTNEGIFICRYSEEDDGSFVLEDIEDEDELQVRKIICEYRAVRREELTKLLLSNGCSEVIWKFPDETGFFQPIVLAKK